MAFVAPTSATFKVRFPEFADADDASVNAALAEAGDDVGEGWIERDRAPAIQYLAAHLMSLRDVATGQSTSSSSEAGTVGDGGAATVGTVGEVKRITVGDETTEYFDSVRDGASGGSASGASSASASRWEGASTYLDRYRTLQRRNFPPVLVV